MHSDWITHAVSSLSFQIIFFRFSLSFHFIFVLPNWGWMSVKCLKNKVKNILCQQKQNAINKWCKANICSFLLLLVFEQPTRFQCGKIATKSFQILFLLLLSLFSHVVVGERVRGENQKRRKLNVPKDNRILRYTKSERERHTEWEKRNIFTHFLLSASFHSAQQEEELCWKSEKHKKKLNKLLSTATQLIGRKKGEDK